MSNESNGSDGKIKVVFLHPSDSEQYPAKIGSATTGQQALDNLVKVDFIKRGDYALTHARTKKTLALSNSLVGSGVADGDEVIVTVLDRGASQNLAQFE